MKGYKATHSDLKCRGYQYEIGKKHIHEGDLVLCNKGFHFCEKLEDCIYYYSGEKDRFFEVIAEEVSHEMGGDSKRVAREITLGKEVFLPLHKESFQLKMVKQVSWMIGRFENPSEKVQLAAVKKNGISLQSIKNPSEKVQIAAVKQNGSALYFISHPSPKVQMAAVKAYPPNILYITKEDITAEVHAYVEKQTPSSPFD